MVMNVEVLIVKKTSATNYDTKAAALDELFPAADTTDNAVGTSTTTELKRICEGYKIKLYD